MASSGCGVRRPAVKIVAPIQPQDKTKVMEGRDTVAAAAAKPSTLISPYPFVAALVVPIPGACHFGSDSYTSPCYSCRGWT